MDWLYDLFGTTSTEKTPNGDIPERPEYKYMVVYFPYKQIQFSKLHRDRDGVHFDLPTAEEKVKGLMGKRSGYTVYYWQQMELKGSFIFGRAKHNRLDGRYEIRSIVTSQFHIYSLKNGDCYWPKKEAAETARGLNRSDMDHVYWVERTQYKVEG